MLMKQLTLESSSHTIIQNLMRRLPLFDEALLYYEQFIQEVTLFRERECSSYRFWKRRQQVMKNYKGYLIDLDGTMYLGTDEIDGADNLLIT